MERKQSLDLSDHLAAGAGGIERLIKKAPEGAAHREDAISTVGALVGLGQKPGRNQLCEEQFEVKEAFLADALDTAAEGSQSGAPGREEGSIRHRGGISTALLTNVLHFYS